MKKLKPCPFCGEIAETFRWRNGRFGVRCTVRGCLAWWAGLEFFEEADAVIAWNRRCSNAEQDN